MKIRSIKLKGDLPVSLKVEMTMAEAILIGRYVGDLVPTTEVSSDIYTALAGGVFNLYWDDGLQEAEREGYV